MGQNNYTSLVVATVWSCSRGIFKGQRKEYHTASFMNLNIDIRDVGCSLATLELNVIFLISLPTLPPQKSYASSGEILQIVIVFLL